MSLTRSTISISIDETYSMIVDNVTIATSLVKLTEKVKKAVEENLSTTDMKEQW